MPEHTPAPTPHRAIYGFAFYLLFLTLSILYVLWAYLPTKQMGLTYLPDKYFALLLPVVVLTGLTLFVFFVYPAINMSLTPEVDELASIVDVNLLQRQNSRCPDVALSWHRLRTAIEQTQTTPVFRRSKTIESCDFCQGTHPPVSGEPIETARFMDLKEMNRSLFH